MLESLLIFIAVYTFYSIIYFFWIDKRMVDPPNGAKTYDDRLSNCPKCGERTERGFSARNGLGWIPINKMKQFAFVGEHLYKAGLRRIFTHRAEYTLSYHCPNCRLYIMDYDQSCSREQANQLANAYTISRIQSGRRINPAETWDA